MEEEGSEHIASGGGSCGWTIESIEGAFGEIDVHDQFDQSSKILDGLRFQEFFSAKREKLVEFSAPGKKKEGPAQILTGLVELVVGMDFARFNANRLGRAWVACVTALDMSPTVPLVSTRSL